MNQQAIEHLKALLEEYTEVRNGDLLASEVKKLLPSLEKPWILVSERMPEDSLTPVLFQLAGEPIEIGIGLWIPEIDKWDAAEGFLARELVKYWQPLPEPVKEKP